MVAFTITTTRTSILQFHTLSIEGPHIEEGPHTEPNTQRVIIVTTAMRHRAWGVPVIDYPFLKC
jgi:hypothetical protein